MNTIAECNRWGHSKLWECQQENILDCKLCLWIIGSSYYNIEIPKSIRKENISELLISTILKNAEMLSPHSPAPVPESGQDSKDVGPESSANVIPASSSSKNQNVALDSSIMEPVASGSDFFNKNLQWSATCCFEASNWRSWGKEWW